MEKQIYSGHSFRLIRNKGIYAMFVIPVILLFAPTVSILEVCLKIGIAVGLEVLFVLLYLRTNDTITVSGSIVTVTTRHGFRERSVDLRPFRFCYALCRLPAGNGSLPKSAIRARALLLTRDRRSLAQLTQQYPSYRDLARLRPSESGRDCLLIGDFYLSEADEAAFFRYLLPYVEIWREPSLGGDRVQLEPWPPGSDSEKPDP